MKPTTYVRRLLACMALLAIVGAPIGSAPPARAADVVHLKFWDMVWGPPEYIATGKQLIAKFNATHPAIQVTYQSIPWNNWYQTYATALASGSGPDMSTGAGYQAFQFADKGFILPLDSLVASWKKDGSLNDFQPGTVSALVYQGHQVAIPWGIDIRVMYYRTDLFAKAGITHPPATWAEFRADAKKLTDAHHGVYGFGMSGDTLGEHNILSFMIDNGGGLFTPAGKPDLANPRNVEALQFLVSMAKDHSIDPAGAGWQSTDLEKAFGSGRVAMFLANPGESANFPASFLPKMGLMPPLKSPHGTSGTIYWINNIMAYKETKNPAAVLTFMDWYSRNELPLWTQGHTTEIPVRKSFISGAAYFKTVPFVQQVLTQWIPVARTTAARGTSLFPQLNAVEGQGFLQTMAQRIILGQDVNSMISQANSDFEATMKGQ